jgi:hypothetical protein
MRSYLTVAGTLVGRIFQQQADFTTAEIKSKKIAGLRLTEHSSLAVATLLSLTRLAERTVQVAMYAKQTRHHHGFSLTRMNLARYYVII